MHIVSITAASRAIQALPFWGVRNPAIPVLTPAQADVLRSARCLERSPFALQPLSGTDHFLLTDLTLPPLSKVVYRLTQENAFATASQEVDLLTRVAIRRGATTRMSRQARGFGKGQVSYPRLETMISLLIRDLGDLGCRDPLIVDNGPRSLTHISMVAARLGGRVMVKEPDYFAAEAHRQVTQRELPGRIAARIWYLQREEEVNRRIAADIAFWTSPDPGMLDSKVLKARGFEHPDPYEYMGRDVRPGGLLMIQTCDSQFSNHPYHPRRWSKLATNVLFEDDLIVPTKYVMPDHAPLGNYLVILRRLS